LQFGDAVLEVANVVDRRLFWLVGSGWKREVYKPTCKIASLCISPLHAGIMSLSTPNSSFIFDLLLRSIKLCAVFRAIFRPATLVEDGCFFLGEGAVFPDRSSASFEISGSFSTRGFIWIIFLDLVGGGGSANTSFAGACATDDLRRVFTVSLTGLDGDCGEVGWYEEVRDDLVEAVEALFSVTAGGGSSKDIWSEVIWEPSLLWISVEEAGVKGLVGMADVYIYIQCLLR